MPKYRVMLDELVTYEIEVEATNEYEAADAAEEAFVQAEDTGKFFLAVKGRLVSDVEEI